MIKRLNRGITAGAGLGLLLLAATGAEAQQGNLGLVVLDGSITGDVTQPPGGVVPPGGDANYLIIEGYGHKQGANLFHSFDSFSIGDGENATFTTKGSIDNIISRVTGGDASNLLGELESPDANLYLLNPYGVFFGENASVDVNGSFYVSTADALNFENGPSFLTAETTTPVSFAATPPASFGFLVDDPAPIEFATRELCNSPCVPAGETFSVVGGNILIDGLDDNSRTINLPGGQIQLVSVALAGVDVPLDASALDVDAHPPGSFGDVRLENRAILTVPSDGRSGTTGTGKIVIRGGQFVLAGSDLEAVAGRGSIDGQTTAIDVAVTGSITLTNDSNGNLSEVVSSSRDGRSGDIRFSGDRFTMDSGARILNPSRDVPNGPDIYVDANTIELIGTGQPASRQTQIFARPRGGAGTGSGDIHLSGKAPGTADRAESVSISEFAQVLVTSEDDAAGGSIGIATESLSIEQNGEVVAITRENGTSGTVRIDAGNALLADGGRIVSETQGQNAGADITITGETLTLTRGGEISTQVSDESATGHGGNIDIDVANLLVTERGLIASTNLGEGNGGDIGIVAVESLTVSNGGQIVARTGPVPQPPPTDVIDFTDAPAAPADPVARGGGNLTIDAGRLTVMGEQGASVVTQIATITNAEGQTGTDVGRGGDLDVHAEQIDLIDGGQLRSNTLDSAPAGDLHVVALGSEGIPGMITIAGLMNLVGPNQPPTPTPSGIFATSGLGASTNATGAGGPVLVEADIVEVTGGGEIGSSAFNQGPAGSLTVIASERVTVRGENGEKSIIAAQGDDGAGGDLNLTTGLLELIDGGELSVTTLRTGDSGNMNVVADEIVLRGGNEEGPSGIFAQSVSALSTGGNAGTIDIQTTGDFTVTDGAQLTVRTFGGGDAGDIIVRADNIDILNDGLVAAESLLASPAAGAAGSIDLGAVQNLQVASARVSTETAEAQGGSIRLAAEQINVRNRSEVSAKANGTGGAGDIVVENTREFTLNSKSVMTAETGGSGEGGQIVFQNVDDVFIRGGSEVTTKSTGQNGGTAGSIAIAANDRFRLEEGSEITTTAADAGGGRISIQAADLVYVLDSTVKTNINVEGDDNPGAGAGDINITFRGDETSEVPPEKPDFVVINRSSVSANATGLDANAGNIAIEGSEVLISADSVIEATSETGVEGTIEITSPDADVVSQVTPLPTTFTDPSDRLLPPCAARTERTGSFIVQNRATTPPSPDAPLPASLGTGVDGVYPSDSAECSVFEEKI